MHPRIGGFEIESATIATKHGQPLKDFWSDIRKQDVFANCLPPGLAPEYIGGKEHFLKNGAMICIDTGFHFEYASPEALFPHDIVIYEKAAELFLEMLADRVNTHLQDEGIEIKIYKNNRAKGKVTINGLEIDGEVSYGAHENYLMDRRAYTEANELFFWLYAPFRVTAQLFTGNGYVYLGKHSKLSYELSQRAGVTVEMIGGATTSNRAIINTRDETLCGTDLKDAYRRLHVIMGDANIAQTALLLKYGTTDIVLDMIETGFFRIPLFGRGWNILDLLHQFSEDSGLRNAFAIDEKPYTIVDMQEEYWKLANRFFQTGAGEYTQERREIMLLWKMVIMLAKNSRPHEALAPLLDWAAKKLILEYDGERHGYELGKLGLDPIKNPRHIKHKEGTSTIFDRAKSIDLDYAWMNPKGIAHVLETKGILKRRVSDEEVRRAVFSPISAEGRKTRAYARAEQLKWIKKNTPAWREAEMARDSSTQLIASAEWARIKLSNGDLFDNGDPFNAKPRIPAQFKLTHE